MLQIKKTSSILLFLHTHGALDVNHYPISSESAHLISRFTACTLCASPSFAEAPSPQVTSYASSLWRCSSFSIRTKKHHIIDNYFPYGGFSLIFRKIFYINLIKNSKFIAKIIYNPRKTVYTLPKRISYEDRS